jgi:GDPmannose 4,6-dehydratase
MWLMLQQNQPDDSVFATGESHSVREFVETAFAHVGRHIEWRGKGVEGVGMDKGSNQPLVSIDPRDFPAH